MLKVEVNKMPKAFSILKIIEVYILNKKIIETTI